MTTLADKAILLGADNHPPMLEKDMPRKYSELTPTEAIQADCDVKETNIIIQGKRVKLYDEFNKFAYKKGETLRDFYLRFSLLLNDMNIYNVKLEQFQVNTKFVNTLPLEWSKFVTVVKLQGDDPIDAINHMMSFLSAVVTSCCPTTNNLLRNSSNPRQQATINDGRVTLQPVQGKFLLLLGKDICPNSALNLKGNEMILGLRIKCCRRIIAVARLTIMKKYEYGHLEEIEVRRDDQQLYTFKEGDFKRLRLQDIEDLLLLLVQQKLTNLTIDERYDFNVALRYREAALSEEVDAESGKVCCQNRRDLPRDIALDSVEVLRDYTHFYRISHSELVGIEKVAVCSSLRSLKLKCTFESRAKRSSINLIRTLIHYELSDTKVFTMMMEILLEPTSNKLSVERFDNSAGNHIKEILLKLNLPDHRILKDGGEGT
uniref:Uncharacterized protein n=1 Tax=Tanacetum cinerariifolium TaxID=118510 RepID=A0A6L2LFX3_TANCI|nr:hypothetical protein [Tanacetum cinerariifolium]